jgi:hypothetical protein
VTAPASLLEAEARLRRELEDLKRKLATMAKYRGRVKDPAALVQIDAAAAETRATFDRIEHDLGVMAQMVAELGGLPSADKARRVGGDMAQPQEAEGRRVGRPTKSKHPFSVALEARGSTVAEWARAHGYEREVVKSWISKPPHGRRIPMVVAKLIEKQLGVPASEAVWRNGIR